MELSGYLAVARRWWWTLLVATWVAAVSGYVVASQIPPTYEARVQLLVGPYNTDTDTLRAAGQLVQTYAELITTKPLLESAVAEVGGGIDPRTLGAATRVTANDTTRFLSIRVQDTDPEMAARYANALADEIILLASRGTSRPEGQLQVVDIAEPPLGPIAPQVSLIVGMAAIAALLGAMVLVMLFEYLSATIRTEDDLRRLTRVPFLGRVVTAQELPTSQALVDTIPGSAAAAGYRLVVAKTAFRDGEDPVRSVVVVGTGSDGGTAQVAANLAATAARAGRQVILIDADTTEAHVTRIFSQEGRIGLADVLVNPGTDVVSSLVRITPTLRLVPRGTAAEADTVDVAQASGILGTLHDLADLVVVSSGPLHLSAGTLVWARAADTSILVAVRDQSRRDDVTYAIESQRLVGVHVAGSILAERRRALGRIRLPTDEPIDQARRQSPAVGDPERGASQRMSSSESGDGSVGVTHARPAGAVPGEGRSGDGSGRSRA